jgi:uncharacterized protein (DUF305 family)
MGLAVLSGCEKALPPGPGHNAGDIAFVEALIPHHRAGIALAERVAKQPAHRVLAEAIISTQRDEITRMTGWLALWGVTAAPAASPKTPGGDPVKALAAHQEQAVTIAQQEQAQGSNRAALDFAQQVIESRTAEASELRSAG